MSARRLPALAAAAAYACFYGAIGSMFPFLAVHYRRMGLDGAHVGVLVVLGPICVALFAPLWGMLADRLHAHRAVLRASLLPAAAAVLLLITGSTSFEMLLPGTLAWAFFISPSAALLDSYALAVAERDGVAFGRLRMFGTLGYIVAVSSVGAWMGDAVDGRFLYIYGAGLALTALATLAFPALHARTARMLARRDVVEALRQPALTALLATYFIISVAASSLNLYFGIYMAELGASARLIAVSITLLAIAEMPVLFASGRIVARLGPRRMITIALCVYAARLLLYSLITRPEWVLPVQLSNGLSFGLMMLAVTRLAHEFAGERLAATAQGLLASSQALGSIVGLLASGILLDAIGLRSVFRALALVALLALAVYAVGVRKTANG
jgi:oligosaccharide:H+ symporter